MTDSRLVKSLKGCVKPLKACDGFSLVELLVAILILTLIVMAFTPLLVGSIYQIGYAGDKTEALYEGQSEMEVNIAERNTEHGNMMKFTFPENPHVTIEVPGEAVSVDIDKGDASAWLSGFIPYLPYINLTDPALIKEGYEDQLLVTVEGSFTDLQKASTIEIYKESNPEDKFNYPLNLTYSDPTNNREIAKFTLSQGLTVSNNPHIASVSWDVADVGVLTVVTRLYIHRPDIVTVGEGQRIWISPDSGSIWNERDYDKGGTGSLNDVTWTSISTCVAVSGNGRTIVWNIEQEPAVSDSRSDLILNSVSHGGSTYLAVGNDGKVLISNSETGFLTGSSTTVPEAESSNLNAVTYGNGTFKAVGSNGTVLTYNAGNWEDISPKNEDNEKLSDLIFYGIAYNTVNSEWVTVGGNSSNGAVIYKIKGNELVKVTDLPEGSSILNDVIYDGENYIAVGNTGLVLKSPNGTDWSFIDVGTTNDLYDIEWGNLSGEAGNKDYVIVGQNGTVITSVGDGLDTWEQQSGITRDIFGVAIRYEQN